MGSSCKQTSKQVNPLLTFLQLCPEMVPAWPAWHSRGHGHGHASTGSVKGDDVLGCSIVWLAQAHGEVLIGNS